MNEQRQKNIYELVKALKPLATEEAKKLNERGYAPYFNGLRLLYGSEKVLIGKREDGRFLVTVIREYSSGIQYVSFALTGIYEQDKALLDAGVAGVEHIFSKMPKSDVGLVTVEGAGQTIQ